MKTFFPAGRALTAVVVLFLTGGSLTAQNNLSWAKRIGAADSDIGWQSDLDASGNIYTTGVFSGTTDLDPGTAVLNFTPIGTRDMFVIKQDPSGNLLWAVAIEGGAGSSENPQGLTVDGSGNVYITGYFSGSGDFEPGAGVTTLTSAGNLDMFVIKLSTAGVFSWAKRFGSTDGDFGLGIDSDSQGNAYITGCFRETVDFDPGAGVYNLTAASTGQFDVFVLKLDASGGFVWAKRVGGTGGDEAYGIKVDNSGAVYLSGLFELTADFDPGAAVYNLTSAGIHDVFILKLDSAGDFVWARRAGGTSGSEAGNSIAIDAAGNSYVTGTFMTTSDFDPGTGVYNLTSAGQTDIFVLKLDALGNFVWARSMGGTNYDGGLSIGVDLAGNVFTTGYIYSTSDLDPGAGVYNLVSAGDADIFISKLNASGTFVWAKRMGGTGSDNGRSIVMNPAGNIYVCGSFNATVDFDAGPGTLDLASAGGNDVFILKLQSDCTPTTSTLTASACTSYTLNAQTYTTSGTYTQTRTNAAGCDSTITLNLTIGDAIAPVASLASLAPITDQCSVTALTAPTANDNCAGTVTGTHNATLPITAQGTTVVTWTYNDGNGNTATQTQNVVITDNTAPVAALATLAPITDQCSVTALTAPTANDNCAGTITGTHNASLPITAQGTTVVTWTYNDGHGNTSTQTQNVVITDNVAPVATLANLANVTGTCSVTALTAPTATDNCAGTITGTHNASLPITAQGTTVVTWTYNDGNGNTSTQTQNVVITDNVAPVATLANLANVTGSCSVASLTAPTATDNCAGTITGTTTVTFPITAPGTTVVTWTYNDGHGNTATQTQNVIITVPVATTTLSGLTISATTSGAAYQWINCAGNTPIAGATAQSFTATANGSYAVIVTQNGCSSTSPCVAITTVGMEELSAENLFSVYPNPNAGSFVVNSGKAITLTIMNAAGQLLSTQQLPSGATALQLENAESGIYFLSATDENGQRSLQRVSIVK